MTKRILLLSLLAVLWAVASVAAQEPLSIRKFGGVHDNKALFTMEPGEAVTSINWDYSQLFGGIHKRDGITVKYNAMEQPIGLYGYVQNDGDKYLLAVKNTTNEAGLYYSGIRLSACSLGVSSRYLYKSGVPFFTQYNDIVIVSDGKTPILRYNGSNGDYLVHPRPGSPQFIVRGRNTPVYYLHGNYYYSWQTTIPCDNATYGPLTGISYQVHVDSGTVIIRDFNDLVATGACGNPRPYPTGEVPFLKICRTKANKQPTDSMFEIVIKGALQTFESWELYDSIPDTSLIDSTGSLHPFTGFVDTVTRTADIAIDTSYRIGQPTLMSVDTGTTWFDGVSKGLTSADTVWSATRYFVMWYDSVTMMCSDSGPSVRVDAGWGSNDTTYDSAYNLDIPNRPTTNASLMTLICKQRETTVRRHIWDTTVTSADYPAYLGGEAVPVGYHCSHDQLDFWYGTNRLYWDFRTRRNMCRGVAITDTTEITVQLDVAHVVDTIEGTDSVWSDTLSWGQTNLLPIAYPGWTLPPMKYPTVYNDRVYMAEGSKVYYSDVTTDGPEIARWSPANAFAVNPDDGDEITGLWVCDGKLFIGKNRSIYTAVYANGVHLVEVFVRGVGCVAPRSIIDLPGGGFAFLSEHGVYSFSPALQSLYKESGGNLPGISDAIQNHLDKYTISQLSTCVSWLANDDRNLVFSFPAVDTSWVYSIPTGQWGAWVGFSPSVTTRYDTLYQVDQRPFDGILFTQDGSDSIYLFGSGKTDTGKAVTATWKSGPLFQTYDYGWLWQYGLWSVGNDSTKTITTTIYNHLGASKTYTDSIKAAYYKTACSPVESNWFQFQIQTSADSCAIQGIDWWWQPGSEGGVK